MSVVKVIEIISEGKNIDEALKSAIEEASKTVQEIRQINVQHIEGIVENNKIAKIRVNSKISFLVNHSKSDKKSKTVKKK